MVGFQFFVSVVVVKVFLFLVVFDEFIIFCGFCKLETDYTHCVESSRGQARLVVALRLADA